MSTHDNALYRYFLQVCGWRDGVLFQFFKFGLVGLSGFVVDTCVYFLAQYIGIGHVSARVISYWCAATNNWFLNRKFTFGDRQDKRWIRQWLKYLCMTAFTFVLNTGSYYLLTTSIEFFIEYKYAAFLFGIAAGMIFNFVIARLMVFTGEQAKS